MATTLDLFMASQGVLGLFIKIRTLVLGEHYFCGKSWEGSRRLGQGADEDRRPDANGRRGAASLPKVPFPAFPFDLPASRLLLPAFKEGLAAFFEYSFLYSCMKATLEIPDELYALVKARAALEGRTLRSVAIELFAEWTASRSPARQRGDEAERVEEGKATEEPKQGAAEASRPIAEKKVDPLDAHRAHLRKIMLNPRAIDEIGGVLTGTGPDMDMAAMRSAYEQRLAEAWKRRHP